MGNGSSSENEEAEKRTKQPFPDVPTAQGSVSSSQQQAPGAEPAMSTRLKHVLGDEASEESSSLIDERTAQPAMPYDPSAEIAAREAAERAYRETYQQYAQQQRNSQAQRPAQVAGPGAAGPAPGAGPEQRTPEHTPEHLATTVPFVFQWSHGGRDVYVAYSGDDWSQKYRMHRSHKDFTLVMDLRPGVYHYKFIVDNAWRCAPDQKHVRDTNGAYSNVCEVKSSSVAAFQERQTRSRRARPRYAQRFPEREQYIQDPPVAPPQLGFILLNQKPHRGHHPLILPEPNTVSINHLNVADKREEDVVTLGLTERFKDKFVTTVYYKPIDSRGTLQGGVSSIAGNVRSNHWNPRNF